MEGGDLPSPSSPWHINAEVLLYAQTKGGVLWSKWADSIKRKVQKLLRYGLAPGRVQAREHSRPRGWMLAGEVAHILHLDAFELLMAAVLAHPEQLQLWGPRTVHGYRALGWLASPDPIRPAGATGRPRGLLPTPAPWAEVFP